MGKLGKSKNQEANARRHAFLRTLFPKDEEKYAILKMNGFVLVRQLNRGADRWEVAIYTEESFKTRQDYLSSKSTSPSPEPPYQLDL